MPMMSRDLRFSAKALDVIGDLFPEMEIMPAKPDMRTRRGLGDELGADDSVAARAIVDDDRLAPFLASSSGR